MSDFLRFQIIKALAGSGKTQELTYRFIRLLALGANPASILATTFSRKAAGEIRDRIIELLARALLDTKALKQLEDGVPELQKSSFTTEDLLRILIKDLHRLNIGTIDSFFVRTAKSFSDFLPFRSNWSILDEAKADGIFSHAVQDLTSDSSEIEGIAKTLQLSRGASRVPVKDTLEQLCRDAYISIRNSSREAWYWGQSLPVLAESEIKAAIELYSGLNPENGHHRNDLVKSIERFQNKDWVDFLTKGMASKVLDESFVYFRVPLEQEIISALKPLVKHALHNYANTVILKNANTYDLMRGLHKSWSSLKHEEGVYSFDDIAYYLSKSMIMEDLAELQYRLDSSIDHLLVDEFQDTSLTQWGVLKPLVDEIHQSENDRSLFFVGDVKQSLYGFRGGEPSLLRNLPDVYNIDPQTLLKSWRCATPVLEAVNTLFLRAHLIELFNEHAPGAAKLWQADYPPHKTARPNRKGYAAIHTTNHNDNQSTLEHCIEYVTTLVSKIHFKSRSASIGVLVRNNTKNQIQRLVHALRSNSEGTIIAAEYGGNSLTDSPPVTVLLSLLLLADHPGNTVARFHVCTSPLGDFFDIHFQDEKRWHELSAKIRNDLLANGYATLMKEYAEKLVGHSTDRDKLRLWQLVECAEILTVDNQLRPSHFVNLIKKTQVPDPASSKVQVMTIHQSKGLSFDAVVVCDLDQNLWRPPNIMEYHSNPWEPPDCAGLAANDIVDYALPDYSRLRSETKKNQVNDALCLMYVAMTRAKHALHLVVPSRPTADKYHKKLDGFVLEGFNLSPNQPPNQTVWVADGSDEQWHEELSEADNINPPFGLSSLKLKKSSNEGLTLGRGIQSSSPSSLEGEGALLLKSRFAKTDSTVFDQGTLIHAWLEQIDWLTELPTDEWLEHHMDKEAGNRLGSSKVSATKKVLLQALELKGIRSILTKPKGNIQVFNEQRFAVRFNPGSVFDGVKLDALTDMDGTIDRLVVHYNEKNEIVSATIIDWKSDSIDSNNFNQKVAYYRPQLAAYLKATSRLLCIDARNITAKLAFLKTGQIVDLTFAD